MLLCGVPGHAPRYLLAQESPRPVQQEVFTGGEFEDYLRTLQVAGLAAPYPWSVRGFSAREIERIAPSDSLHPWAARYRFGADSTAAASSRARVIAPMFGAILNSARPYGYNDGAVWAGRGLTARVRLGVAGRWGPLSITLAPEAFVAQNASFELKDNGQSGRLAFADPLYPKNIDLPQRFGNGAYGRVDPGQSTVRLDVGPGAVGVSTANQFWGPAVDHPLILGNNAPGFAHVFLGSSRPVNLGIGRLHGRVVWGRLEQSAYSSMPRDSAVRFMSGVVAVFQPRGLAGLELGGTRFFHTAWPVGGIGRAELLKPLGGILKEDVAPDGAGPGENQLASVFFRWLFPRSGFEAYGEYAREDHNYDLRDLALEPDHDSGYTLGFRRVWRRENGSLTALRGEWIDTEPSHLGQARPQTPFYVHSELRQGHTNRGQLLGSPAGLGGGGSVLALDRYTSNGRRTLFWTRLQSGALPWSGKAASAPDAVEITHGVGAEVVWFRGRYDIGVNVTGVYGVGRGGSAGSGFNLHSALSLRAAL